VFHENGITEKYEYARWEPEITGSAGHIFIFQLFVAIFDFWRLNEDFFVKNRYTYKREAKGDIV